MSARNVTEWNIELEAWYAAITVARSAVAHAYPPVGLEARAVALHLGMWRTLWSSETNSPLPGKGARRGAQ